MMSISYAVTLRKVLLYCALVANMHIVYSIKSSPMVYALKEAYSKCALLHLPATTFAYSVEYDRGKNKIINLYSFASYKHRHH